MQKPLLRSAAVVFPAIAATLMLGMAGGSAQPAPAPRLQPHEGQVARPDISANELEALSPSLRADLQARMAGGGQTRREIIETTLMNNLQERHEAREIIAMDYRQGTVTFRTLGGDTRTASFDRATLQVLN
jgi:hypothetical protein